MGISYDPVEALAGFATRQGITFPLLADPQSKTIDAYGIRDPQGDGIPAPAVFLVGSDGIIRAKLAEEGYRTRPSTEALIAAARKLK